MERTNMELDESGGSLDSTSGTAGAPPSSVGTPELISVEAMLAHTGSMSNLFSDKVILELHSYFRPAVRFWPWDY